MKLEKPKKVLRKSMSPRISEFKTVIEVYKIQVQTLTSEKKELQINNIELKVKVNSLNDKLDQQNTELKNLYKQISKLQLDNENLSTQFHKKSENLNIAE